MKGIFGRHFQLFFHGESLRMKLQAFHTINFKAKTLTSDSGSVAVEHGDQISLGDCLFTFQYTDYASSQEYREDFHNQMRLTPILGSHSTASRAPSASLKMSVEQYSYEPAPFTRGSYGEVYQGWHQETGDRVAVKRLISPEEKELDSHQRIMSLLGHHVSS